jgi:hypothetical protein
MPGCQQEVRDADRLARVAAQVVAQRRRVGGQWCRRAMTASASKALWVSPCGASRLASWCGPAVEVSAVLVSAEPLVRFTVLPDARSFEMAQATSIPAGRWALASQCGRGEYVRDVLNGVVAAEQIPMQFWRAAQHADNALRPK